MAHRIREGLLGREDGRDPFTGDVEVDETYVGGRKKPGSATGSRVGR